MFQLRPFFCMSQQNNPLEDMTAVEINYAQHRVEFYQKDNQELIQSDEVVAEQELKDNSIFNDYNFGLENESEFLSQPYHIKPAAADGTWKMARDYGPFQYEANEWVPEQSLEKLWSATQQSLYNRDSERSNFVAPDQISPQLKRQSPMQNK